LGLGTLYTLEQRFAEAEKQLLCARLLVPNDWRVHFELGELYWRAGDLAKAEVSLQRAIELDGKLPRAHLLMINVLAGQEKHTETLTAMETFLRTFPRDRFAQQVGEKRDLLRAELTRRSASKEAKQP
jgi:Flp pilus assembly protein TadD